MEESVINNPANEGELKLKLRVQEVEAQLLELKIKNDELLRDNTQIKRENAQLKRMPLFIAVVIDILENGEVYLRQQGNNQEYLTHVGAELGKELKPGTRVAVNNALSIVKIVGSVFDSRVRVMELDESPSITFKQIGGLQKEIEEVRESVEYPLTKPHIF